jgi:predicted nucleotidyltransferase
MRIRSGLDVPDLALSEVCRRYRVRSLELFGSSARDEHRPDSDIDLLVAFEPDTEVGFLHLASLQSALEDLLGRHVDLVPLRGLEPLIRESVLHEARLLVAA